MKYEKGICKECGEERYIVNRTHYLCSKCNTARLRGQEGIQKPSFNDNGSVAPKRYKIASRSPKRMEGEKKYEAVKKQKRLDMIEGGYYKCFFTNRYIREEDEANGLITWHHVLGRTGALLWDYRNIFPAYLEYHDRYHHERVATLMKERWYKDFVNRLRQLNHKAYNKEMNRWFKAGFLDEESLTEMFK